MNSQNGTDNIVNPLSILPKNVRAGAGKPVTWLQERGNTSTYLYRLLTVYNSNKFNKGGKVLGQYIKLFERYATYFCLVSFLLFSITYLRK